MDNAGDMVLMGPALRALRGHLPEARIDVLASPAGSAAAGLLPWIDGVLTASAPWQDATGDLPVDPARELILIAQLAAGRYDTAIVFTSFSQTAWPAAYALYLAGIPHRIGYADRFGGSVLSFTLPYPAAEVHEAERDLHLIECLGVPVRDRQLEVYPGVAARRRAARLLGDSAVDGNLLLVAPGASCASRRWWPARYGEAAARIAEEQGLEIVVTGTRAETRLAREVADACGGTSFAGQTDLPVLAACVERAAIVLTGNSLVMHLADALGRPAVVLFSGTDLVSQWAPRHVASSIVRRDVPCSPCYLFDCPIGLTCLDVTTAEVTAAAHVAAAAQAARAADSGTAAIVEATPGGGAAAAAAGLATNGTPLVEATR
jgi:ADP-heptose:LPS heptosyltransferase